jgi:hypothetical protein
MNDTEAKQLFVEISELKAQKVKLEEEIEEKQALAFDYLTTEGVDRLGIGGLGTFYMLTSPVYTYSDQVQEAMSQVKSLKKTEEEQGIATVDSSRTQLRLVREKENNLK